MTPDSVAEPLVEEKAPDASSAPIPPDAQRAFLAAVERHRLGDNAGAIKFYRQAIELHAGYYDALNNLAVLLNHAKKLPAAVACMKRALLYAPPSAAVYSNLGNFLWQILRFEEAAVAFRKSLELEPGRPETLHNLGLLLHSVGDDDAAIDCFTRSIARNANNPDVHWDRSLTRLCNGDIVQGFREYEVRWNLKHNPMRPFPMPQWKGEDLAGKTIFVHSEQGLGDSLQFVRYLPMLAERGARVIFGCPVELIRIMQGFPGVSELISSTPQMPAADFHVPLLSLPFRFGTTLETIPAPIPYLGPPPGTVGPRVPRPPGTKATVAIVWAGKPTHENDKNRSATLELFMSLIDIPGINLVSLQKGTRAVDLATLGVEALVYDLGSQVKDFAESAAVMQQIDLLVSIDTAIVHLAGAMGRPAFVMLPFTPDWRWMRHREDTPWYPSLRLFRQTQARDWESVMKRVYDAVTEFVAAQPAR